ncbi:MAG: hypothetical protein NVS3B10_30800 [Polyangiales bacterium]
MAATLPPLPLHPHASPSHAVSATRAIDTADGFVPASERATRGDDWKHTNEAGAYASSTRALVHTRGDHGLLVVPGDAHQHVVLSRLELRALPSHARTTGRRTLADLLDGIGLVAEAGLQPEPVRFVERPLPEWELAVPNADDPSGGDEGLLRMTLGLDATRAALVVRYSWEGDAPLHLQIRPLLAMRALHERGREHGAMCQVVEVRHGEARVRPRPDLPRVCFGHGGIFVGSPDWWRAPLGDHATQPPQVRQPAFAEDLWSPGAIEALLRPGAEVFVTCALGTLPEQAPRALLEAAADRVERGA